MRERERERETERERERDRELRLRRGGREGEGIEEVMKVYCLKYKGPPKDKGKRIAEILLCLSSNDPPTLTFPSLDLCLHLIEVLI